MTGTADGSIADDVQHRKAEVTGKPARANPLPCPGSFWAFARHAPQRSSILIFETKCRNRAMTYRQLDVTVICSFLDVREHRSFGDTLLWGTGMDVGRYHRRFVIVIVS
jgi:hypothetical protein